MLDQGEVIKHEPVPLISAENTVKHVSNIHVYPSSALQIQQNTCQTQTRTPHPRYKYSKTHVKHKPVPLIRATNTAKHMSNTNPYPSSALQIHQNTCQTQTHTPHPRYKYTKTRVKHKSIPLIRATNIQKHVSDIHMSNTHCTDPSCWTRARSSNTNPYPSSALKIHKNTCQTYMCQTYTCTNLSCWTRARSSNTNPYPSSALQIQQNTCQTHTVPTRHAGPGRGHQTQTCTPHQR